MEKREFNGHWMFTKEGEAPVKVRLPHDAMQTERRTDSAASGSGCGYYEGNHYIYEKRFATQKEWEDKALFIELQGVYPNGKVYLNHQELGYCNYGYLNYFFRLDGLKPCGEENVLRVEIDNTTVPNSRWYSGAGLYRGVYLWMGGKRYIRPQGIRVKTEDIHTATIRVLTDISGMTPADADLRLLVRIEYRGAKIAEGEGSDLRLHIPDARLWSDKTPELYQCIVELYESGILADRAETSFGIRDITYGKQGLFINGKETLLRGGCIHHDNGILGAREYPVSAYRKIRRLKEFGFNAVRIAHNPASSEILNACDELGMYVMDEAWDMWYTAKNREDYANSFLKYWEKDITAMVEHDMNHPSVILYSIGNEVSEPAKAEGIALAKKIIEKCHQLDDTRPVTCGINITILLMNLAGMMGAVDAKSKEAELSEEQKTIAESLQDMDSTRYNEMVSTMGQQMIMAAASEEADMASSPVLELLDIAGYNYGSSRYEQDGSRHPGRVIVGTETYAFQLHENWEAVKRFPYLIGDFMWTAWDYLGEAGVGAWSYEADAADFQKRYPWLLADTGALDILGNPNGEAGLAKAVWGAGEEPFVGVVPVNRDQEKLCRAMWRGSNALPYYSYQNCERKGAVVEVYSGGSRVELSVNGRVVGNQQVWAHKAEFCIAYEAGELKAAAYDEKNGLLGETVLRSAAGEKRIRILAEEEPVIGKPLYVKVDIVGENGEIECNADEELALSVSGGEMLAFGSAIPRTEADFLSGSYPTWYGRAQAVILPTRENVTVRVTGEKLREERLTLTALREKGKKCS